MNINVETLIPNIEDSGRKRLRDARNKIYVVVDSILN
jgi:hypothetical protein